MSMTEEEFKNRVKDNERMREEFAKRVEIKVQSALHEMRKNPQHLVAIASKLAWDAFLEGSKR